MHKESDKNMNTTTHVSNLKKQHDELSNLINAISAHPITISNEITIGENTLQNPTLCQIWDAINNILIGSPYENKCGYYGVLGIIKAILKDILCYEDLCSCELKQQLKNTIELIDYLEKTLECVNCDDDCPELIGKLFCLLVRLIILLSSIITKIIILILYCDDDYTHCTYEGLVNHGFCKCLICEFERELCEFEELIHDFKRLSIDFTKCDMRHYNSCENTICKSDCHSCNKFGK